MALPIILPKISPYPPFIKRTMERIDGLVIHSDRSCKPYSVGQYDMRRLLAEDLGVKTVVIEADMTDSRVYSEEQTRTRLEAFFEALESQ